MTPEEMMGKAIEANATKIYDQAASGAVTEVGKIGTDVMKTLRLLFTIPFQYAAHAQDRLDAHLKRTLENVTSQKFIEPPMYLAGPIINQLGYMEEDNYLADLYRKLLARSMDADRVNEAHPAFLQTISQLAPDEARILGEVAVGKRQMMVQYSLVLSGPDLGKVKIKLNGDPDAKIFTNLDFPVNFCMYIEHMQTLGLLKFHQSFPQSFIDNNIKASTQVFGINEFGLRFFEACIR